MKIRELKTRKDMMMVFDANKKVRNAVEYLVYESEQQNIDSFLDEFEDVFEYSDYSFENESITVNRTGPIEDLESAICDLDDYDYLPPEFNLHKLLELSNMYICTDDDIKADEILGEILDEFEEGFKRFCQRIKSRDYLLCSLEKFISCDFELFGYILDKEIDDNFYIIEEEPQTPMMRKYMDASKEDFNKIWENNPKFKEMVKESFVKERVSYLKDILFSHIEGASVFFDINKNICSIEVCNIKKFIDSIIESPIEDYSEITYLAKKIANEDYQWNEDDVEELFQEIRGLVLTSHIVINDDLEIREHLANMEQEEMIDEEHLYYDDNFILYHIKSFA